MNKRTIYCSNCNAVKEVEKKVYLRCVTCGSKVCAEFINDLNTGHGISSMTFILDTFRSLEECKKKRNRIFTIA